MKGAVDTPITTLLASMSAQATEGLAAAAAIAHKGEAGRSRENAIRRFLEPLLPAAFHIESGFVIDASGRVSAQQDLIVSRRGYHPKFEVNGVNYFVVESVLAAIQCKARIGSAGHLVGALDNLATVKALDRTAGGRNYRVAGDKQDGPVDPDAYHQQVFTAVVADRTGLSRASLHAAWVLWLKQHPRRHWPNFFAGVRGSLTMSYCPDAESGAAAVNPMKAAHSVIGDQASSVSPLVALGTNLLLLSRVAPLIDFDVTRYTNVHDLPQGDHIPL